MCRQRHALNTDEEGILVQSLLTQLHQEEDEHTKRLIIQLLDLMSTSPHISVTGVFKELVTELSSEYKDVRYQVLQCIGNMFQNRQLVYDEQSTQFLMDVMELLVQRLADPYFRVRASCIYVLSLIPSVLDLYGRPKGSSQMEKFSEIEIQKVISNHITDPDPMVRKSALDALVQMRLKGYTLDISLYALAAKALHDDHEEVRMGGLDLIRALSSLYPDHILPMHWLVNRKVRLIDDAFVKISDLVNDVMVVVRKKACVMMASYPHVDLDILMHTFKVRFMSHDKRKSYTRIEKKRRGGPVPVAEGDVDVESDDVRVLHSGACGAFVQAMEDEHGEVRNAAIDSICELCMSNEELVGKATESLLVMFHDEIGSIRINAIQSLRKIGSRFALEFDGEQMENALLPLEESESVARLSTHDLLRCVRFKDIACIPVLIKTLMKNMAQYPEDKLSIYLTLRDVGSRHDDYIESLVLDLLGLDSRFRPKETNVEDPEYIATVILIANACASNTKILGKLPQYMFRQLAYLNFKYPDCFPDLRVGTCMSNWNYKCLHVSKETYKSANIKVEGVINFLPATFSGTVNIASDVDDYMHTILDMFKEIRLQMERSYYKEALVTSELAAKSFQYISTLKPTFAGKASLGKLYLDCYQAVIKIKQNCSSPTYSYTMKTAAASLLYSSYSMEHCFAGLSPRTLRAAIYFRILANMAWMFGTIHAMPMYAKKTATEVKQMLIAFLLRVHKLQDRFERNDHDRLGLTDLRQNLEASQQSTTTVNMRKLHSFFASFTPLEIDLNNAIKATSANILHPVPSPDKPLKFKSVHPIQISFEADIIYAFDISHIAIEILEPDGSSSFFWPAPHQFKPTRPHCYKLTTVIDKSFSAWTAPASLTLRLVRSFEPDLPRLDNHIMAFPNESARKTATEAIIISNEIKYTIWPTMTWAKPNNM
ncbi:Integrator complex subunit 4 [Apophysomyces ossiformis]|uniref:Integrator complex subunit 4 n=1 Tax=Apophysomyces ossiformis TaxID=679940 RepID=A0A8H7BKS2_9FUNG|nr:Integrator complex subunit 4 [Apophysomyces ossiformis]